MAMEGFIYDKSFKHYTCLTLMMQAGMTHFLPDSVGTYHTWVGLWLVFLF